MSPLGWYGDRGASTNQELQRCRLVCTAIKMSPSPTGEVGGGDYDYMFVGYFVIMHILWFQMFKKKIRLYVCLAEI